MALDNEAGAAIVMFSHKFRNSLIPVDSPKLAAAAQVSISLGTCAPSHRSTASGIGRSNWFSGSAALCIMT